MNLARLADLNPEYVGRWVTLLGTGGGGVFVARLIWGFQKGVVDAQRTELAQLRLDIGVLRTRYNAEIVELEREIAELRADNRRMASVLRHNNITE